MLPFVLLGVAHGIWGYVADLRLDARIGSLRAAGQRVLPEDFNARSVVPARNNAAPLLAAAAAILNDESVESDAVSWVPSTMPVVPEAWPYLKSAVARFEPALRRIDEAEARPSCDWQHVVRSPVVGHLSVPELNNNRSLTDLLLTAALVEHDVGNDAAALRRLGQVLYLSRSCESSPSSSGHRCAIGIAASFCDRIELFAPRLAVKERDDPTAMEMRALIKDLLDESACSEGLTWCLEASRMETIDLLKQAADPASYLAWPFIATDLNLLLEDYDAALAVADIPSGWPVAQAKLGAAHSRKRWLDIDDARSIRNVMKSHFCGITDRRLAATALAVRLFAADHDGRLPQRLEELVPAYLPAIPADPMSAVVRPISYEPDANDPVLYSVGLNGVDDAGSEAAIPGVHGELNEWQRLDRVFYVSARAREPLYVPLPEGTRIMLGGYPLGIELGTPPWERQQQ